MSAIVAAPGPKLDAPRARPFLTPRGRVLAVAAGWTALLYLATFFVVERHYRELLPHFDSMGSFSAIWTIVGIAQTSGLAVAFERSMGQSLSWLQPFYGLLIAWLPTRSPGSVVGLNFLCLLIA